MTALNASNISSGTVPTARLGSGTASSSTFLRGDSTFQTVNTDLVSDTTPQLGGNLDVNTKNILFGDSSDGSSDDVLKFGAGSDLSLFHNGTDSRIVNTTGDLSIRGNSIKLASTTGEEYVRCTANGSTELFYDNTVMLTTNSDGYRSNDSVKAQFGVGSDLTIYHNGTHNYIDTLANKLHLRVANGENGIVINSNGAVEVYHDNSVVLHTIADGIILNNATDISHSSADNLQLGTGSGSNGITIYSGSDSNGSVYFADGSSGNAAYRGFIEYSHSSDALNFGSGGNTAAYFDSSLNFLPSSDNARNLGSSSKRWANLYTTDLQLSNEGKTNDIDGTWGNYTIQEGESDLFLINNRSGKKYKFNLTEVS